MTVVCYFFTWKLKLWSIWGTLNKSIFKNIIFKKKSCISCPKGNKMCILLHRVFPRDVQLVWRYSAAVPHFSWEASLKFHLTAKKWDSGDEDKDVLRVFSCSFHLRTVLRPASVRLRVLRYWSQWLVLKSTMDSATGDSSTSLCQVGGRHLSLSFLEPQLPLSVLDTFSSYYSNMSAH